METAEPIIDMEHATDDTLETPAASVEVEIAALEVPFEEPVEGEIDPDETPREIERVEVVSAETVEAPLDMDVVATTSTPEVPLDRDGFCVVETVSTSDDISEIASQETV